MKIFAFGSDCNQKRGIQLLSCILRCNLIPPLSLSLTFYIKKHLGSHQQDFHFLVLSFPSNLCCHHNFIITFARLSILSNSQFFKAKVTKVWWLIWFVNNVLMPVVLVVTVVISLEWIFLWAYNANIF